MALIIEDRVAETSTTTGTGNFTLAGAIVGFRAFSAVCSTNDMAYYLIEAIDATGVPTGDWETGLGTYSAANTLTRTTVHRSSNSNSAVNFAAGTKRVTISAIAASGGLLATHVLSAASSVDIENFAGLGYSVIELVMDLQFSSDGDGLRAQLKLNGSYQTGSSYRYADRLTSSSGSTSVQNNGGTTSWGLPPSDATWGVGNAALEGLSGRMTLPNCQSANPKRATFELTYGAPSGAGVSLSGAGQYEGTDYASVVAGIKLLPTTGTFTGTVLVYGRN